MVSKSSKSSLTQLLNAIDVSADWIGLREVKEKNFHRLARNGKFDQHSTVIDHGIMIQVLVDGQFAYYATNSLDIDSVQKAARQAVDLARQSTAWKVHNNSVKKPNELKQDFSAAVFLDQQSIKDIDDFLINASQATRLSDAIINSIAHALITEHETRYVSSNSSEIYQKFLLSACNLSVTAREGNETQTRSTSPICRQNGLDSFNADEASQQVERITQEALKLLKAEECPTGIYDLILTPDQLYLQLHESIGHPLELDRILGDERNYAGGSFIKLSDFKKTLQFGSPLLNVVFDPHVKGEYASYSFDDNGDPASRQHLIKEGKLLRGIGGTESTLRSGVPGVASARASSWNRPPIDRMANINMEPGKSSLKDMIAGTEQGIIMSTNRSWSIDDLRLKFQFGCEYAQLIQDGKITKTLKNPNYRGITSEFWHRLKKVGNASTYQLWGSPMCGKGEPNQGIRVGHGTPTCLFEKIETFGGAA